MINNEIGNNGEAIAEKFLLEKKHRILEKNYRSKFGEIDLISFKDNIYYFNEVKSVKNSKFHPFEQITEIKIRKILKTAKIYMQYKKIYDRDYSISAIGIIFENSNNYKIYYEKNISM